jgi:hypothetical protein
MVEPRSLIRPMIEITENFQAARQEIMGEHPNFDQFKDARISIFTIA